MFNFFLFEKGVVFGMLIGLIIYEILCLIEYKEVCMEIKLFLARNYHIFHLDYSEIAGWLPTAVFVIDLLVIMIVIQFTCQVVRETLRIVDTCLVIFCSFFYALALCITGVITGFHLTYFLLFSIIMLDWCDRVDSRRRRGVAPPPPAASPALYPTATLINV